MREPEKSMKDSISIANYFIDKSVSENGDLTLLKLVKLVYIAHGFLLTTLKQSFLNPKYDRVEAWRFGPVIPNVYHTFKYNAGNVIKEKGIICEDAKSLRFVCPKVLDEEKPVLDFVWKRYGGMKPSTLVDLLHKEGTPWRLHYKPNENVEIPDFDTHVYYTALFNALVNYGNISTSRGIG